ncbi:MAG: LysR family transcriptional regulator [Chromatiaceae bacterium]|nr:LysR family transcriptional regulator [Gammaproteobacteria bacterium]MCP5426915.1 LysR family transcriptional regulator [Chromatiaceae bacterium]MCB1873876.1 LysR family transcriptional regulator [Gammaproteobacteria bacterium]MCB1878809.1 LysR family transcriptional regulator [Gammaproteobacteria bacterium]MCB1904374.1 LysR family transcriptional regulator [Gammaproteobacteria bacterium]
MVIVVAMDIALFKTFLCVARVRHFGKAADALFVTQAAVSARIKLLESTLGVQLFRRERNNIQLTSAGERLRKHAEIIISGWERARLDIALEPEFKRSLAIGATSDLWSIGVMRWMERVYAAYPELALRLEINNSEMLVTRVIDSVLDLAFIFEPPTTAELIARPLTNIPLILVSTRAAITAEEAMHDDYLLVDWGSSFAISHAAFAGDRCIPRMHCTSGAAALDFLLSVGGSCYLAQPMVQAHLDSGSLHPVSGAPVIERYSYAVFRVENESSGLIQDVLTKV